MIWRAIKQTPNQCLISKLHSMISAPGTSNVKKDDKTSASKFLVTNIPTHMNTSVSMENSSIQSDPQLYSIKIKQEDLICFHALLPLLLFPFPTVSPSHDNKFKN